MKSVKNTFRNILLLFLLSTNLYAQTDCPDAIVVCGNHDYYGLDATGIGVQELGANACASVEHNSLWLKIMIKDGGTLGFVITPEEIDDLVVDFDFWLFGPDIECSDLPTATAIRCSTTNPLAAGLDYNLTGMNEESTEVSEGPGPDGDSFVQWIEAEDGDIYYLVIDRPHGSSNFSLEWTGTATFHDIPVFNNPDNIPLGITECADENTDEGVATFDLTTYAEMFIGEQTGVALTYHLSENDMITGENPITSPEAYNNIGNPQTIYMKMTDVVTGCFSNETYEINVLPSIGEPDNLEECSDTGFAVFDFSTNDIPIANGNTDVTITYHNSLENAELETGVLDTSYQNQVAYETEEIWARMENNTLSCIDYVSFTISVYPIPAFDVAPPDITLCDDNVPDGFTDFDLTVNESLLQGNQDDIVFSYYEDMEGIPAPNPIAVPTDYPSVENPQLIHIKIENSETGCFSMGTFMLHVTPSVGLPQDIERCDSDDGFIIFDLSVNDELLQNNIPNAEISYHNSLIDAQNNESPIGPLYENQVPYIMETIWVRFYNPDNGCVNYTDFNIIPVLPPEFETVPDITGCDGDGTDDLITEFDLTVNESSFISDVSNYTFSYFEDNGGVPDTSPIATPEAYTNLDSPQTIHVVMTNVNSGCSAAESFTIQVTPGAGEPEDLYICDDSGIATFDLSENEATIINGISPAAVSYYLSEEDAENSENAIGTSYTNSTPFEPVTIWVRLDIPDINCHNVVSFTVQVVPEPVINNPDNLDFSLTLCDSDGIDDSSTAFNLTEYESIFIGEQTNAVVSYHLTPDDAETGDNPITSPESFANTSNPQTIYVSLTDTRSKCYANTSFTITIDDVLLTGEAENMELCDEDDNGIQSFDLWQNNDSISNDDDNIEVTYYTSQSDAENGVNALNRFYENQEPYIGETIWARIEYIEGCFGHGITSFTINIIPPLSFEHTEDIVDFTVNENSIQINMLDDPDAYEYSLDDINYSSNRYFSNLIPGIYTIYIRSLDGCKTISFEVPILNYPKFFTPNGDGANEIWNVEYIRFYPDARITIFDRYGKLIKSYRGKQIGWDGTYNGENLPATDYWFKLEFSNGRVIKSHFAMIR
ncbi:T9SS type B sorting domain-containing protein [Flavobacterium suaedae]|uniref:T9SS type B sorting domain-containing protein n=1 Tax=Flavobacterium suaedae TaxID=1767027 RepID=UPI00166AD115|nr:T9SS type B sorting domain-containing protein [Flavobacterium suaedae]